MYKIPIAVELAQKQALRILNNPAIIEVYKQAAIISEHISYVPNYFPEIKELEFLNNFHFPNYDISLKLLEQTIKKETTLDLLDEFCELIREQYYVLPAQLPIFTSVKILKHLKSIDDKDKRKEELNNYFYTIVSANKWLYFSNIIKKLEENTRIKQERIKILTDCMDILINCRIDTALNVIIPTLISQVEGIWCDTLNVYVSGEDKKEALKKALNDNSLITYEQAAQKILTKILFKYSKDKTPTCSKFNRNKILHGEEVNYATSENLVRLIFIIEFLSGL